MSFLRSVGCVGVVLVSSACGGGSAAGAGPSDARSADTSAAQSADTATVEAPKRIERIERADVDGAIASGLGVLLRNVEVEDWPVLRDGRFHGFRLRALNPAWNVGLVPGDVILRVNDLPIEHPEEADKALRSLKDAPSLRIAFERDGKEGKIELPIVGAPSPAPTQATP